MCLPGILIKVPMLSLSSPQAGENYNDTEISLLSLKSNSWQDFQNWLVAKLPPRFWSLLRVSKQCPRNKAPHHFYHLKSGCSHGHGLLQHDSDQWGYEEFTSAGRRTWQFQVGVFSSCKEISSPFCLTWGSFLGQVYSVAGNPSHFWWNLGLQYSTVICGVIWSAESKL